MPVNQNHDRARVSAKKLTKNCRILFVSPYLCSPKSVLADFPIARLGSDG